MAAMTRKKKNKKVLTFNELIELEGKRVRQLEDEQEEREREPLEAPNPSGRRVTWRSNNNTQFYDPDSHFLSSNNNTVTTFNDSNKHDTTNSNDSNQSTQSMSNGTMQRNHTTRGRTDILKKDPTLFRERQLKRQLKCKQKRG
mmetsp:Transcript_52346/g.59447  ORF Transcript_52346/g.59447 Transcript_52346/m.59447 type:complete len:143 (+) Transcript_52346:368-796(+)